MHLTGLTDTLGFPCKYASKTSKQQNKTWVLTTMTATRSSISAFIVCCNEEQKIRRCLESVSWCDEIIVVDSGSTDTTLQICSELGATVYHQPWLGYIEQKRYALSLCSSTWILNLDADEVVSDTLREELVDILARDAVGAIREDGFLLNRVVFFLNRWWRRGGWYPEYRLRLCRRDKTTWGGNEPHEKAIVSGATARCKGELQHFSFSDLQDFIARSNTLSSNSIPTLLAKGTRFSGAHLLLRPLARFIKFYLIKRGFREGYAGLIIALLEASAVLAKYAKLWEQTRLSNPDEKNS